jgi:hypothetical protein
LKLRQLQLDFLARQRFESACQAFELVSIKGIGWLRQGERGREGSVERGDTG